jgi:hypothetical protein
MIVFEYFEKDISYNLIYEMLTTKHELAVLHSTESGIPYKVWLAEPVVEPAATSTENVELGYAYCNGDIYGWVKLVSEII